MDPLPAHAATCQRQVMSPRAQGQAALVNGASPDEGSLTQTVGLLSGEAQSYGALANTEGQSSGQSHRVTSARDDTHGESGVLVEQRGFVEGLQSVPVNLLGPPHEEDTRLVAAQQIVQPGHSPQGTQSLLSSPLQEQLLPEAHQGSLMRLRGNMAGDGAQTPVGQPQPSMVRWMSRLTEFLRTTAARGADGVDRVFGEFGFSTPAPSERRSPNPRVMVAGSGSQGGIEISPPEELGHDFSVPMSWVQGQLTPGPTPLFGQEELERLRRIQEGAPLLLGPSLEDAGQPRQSGDSSTGSSGLQLDVQRRLDDYSSRQREEMKRLQQEIFNLRAEKEALEQGRRLGLEHAGELAGALQPALQRPEYREVRSFHTVGSSRQHYGIRPEYREVRSFHTVGSSRQHYRIRPEYREVRSFHTVGSSRQHYGIRPEYLEVRSFPTIGSSNQHYGIRPEYLEVRSFHTVGIRPEYLEVRSFHTVGSSNQHNGIKPKFLEVCGSAEQPRGQVIQGTARLQMTSQGVDAFPEGRESLPSSPTTLPVSFGPTGQVGHLATTRTGSMQQPSMASVVAASRPAGQEPTWCRWQPQELY